MYLYNYVIFIRLLLISVNCRICYNITIIGRLFEKTLKDQLFLIAYNNFDIKMYTKFCPQYFIYYIFLHDFCNKVFVFV